MFITDIISFVISDFSNIIVKSLNQDDIIFKSHNILEFFASMDPGFTFTLAHNNDNNVTSIVWMNSHMRDKFERFGN